MKVPVDLVHIGIQNGLFEPGKIVHQFPGIDVFGGINYLRYRQY
jgi:hypothetical protein